MFDLFVNLFVAYLFLSGLVFVPIGFTVWYMKRSDKK